MRHLLTIAALLAASSTASAPLLNGFDAGLEGWTVSGDNTHQWQAVGGNPGGYLDVNDLAVGLRNRALAPPSWLGDWSALGAGDTLSVDVYVRLITGSVSPPNYMFVLEGPGGRAVAVPSPNPPNLTWSNWSVSLSSADWTMQSGTWAALLSDVQIVQFGAEFVDGEEETRLDNMYLSEAPSSLPLTCVTSLFELSAEDWLVQNTGLLSRETSNGDGGGFLEIADGTGATTLFAGSRFRGDWQPLEDVGTVGLSLRVIGSAGTSLGPVPLIQISGPGGTAKVELGSGRPSARAATLEAIRVPPSRARRGPSRAARGRRSSRT